MILENIFPNSISHVRRGSSSCINLINNLKKMSFRIKFGLQQKNQVYFRLQNKFHLNILKSQETLKKKSKN